MPFESVILVAERKVWHGRRVKSIFSFVEALCLCDRAPHFEREENAGLSTRSNTYQFFLESDFAKIDDSRAAQDVLCSFATSPSTIRSSVNTFGKAALPSSLLTQPPSVSLTAKVVFQQITHSTRHLFRLDSQSNMADTDGTCFDIALIPAAPFSHPA